MGKHRQKLILGSVGIFGLLFSPLQSQCRRFRAGDIQNGTDESLRVASRVDNGAPFFRYPTFRAPVTWDYAIFDVIAATAPRFQNAFDCLMNDMAIIRVNAAHVGLVSDLRIL